MITFHTPHKLTLVENTKMKNPLHTGHVVNIDTFVASLYAQVKKSVKDDYLNTITLNYTHYSGVKEFDVMYGKYAPAQKEDGTFYFDCNPSSLGFKSLSIYYGGAGYKFKTLDEYFEFDPSSLGTGGTNVTTIIQQYIDTKVQDVQATLSTLDSVAPVTNTTALTNVTNLVDQRVMFVEQANTLYAYDANSTDAVDGSSVLPSSTGVGRWKQVNEVINGGEF